MSGLLPQFSAIKDEFLSFKSVRKNNDKIQCFPLKTHLELTDFIHSKSGHLFYLRERENAYTYFAMGFVETFTDKEKLQEILEDEHVHLHGTIHFEGDQQFYVPLLFFKNKKAFINFPRKADDNSIEKYINVLQDIFTATEESKNPLKILNTLYTPNDEDWNHLLNRAQRSFTYDLKKVVLSRKKTYIFKEKVPKRILLSRVIEEKQIGYKCYFEYNHEAFISLSPERLIQVRGNQFEVDALAGTAKPDDVEALMSEKNREEHQLVIEDIVNSLSPLSKEIKVSQKEAILKLNYVHHLISKIEGVSKPDVTLFEVLARLHPTAAMGGVPKHLALKFILEHEPLERGLFTAGLGMISKHFSDYLVGIRSAKIDDQQIEIFAGAGIVPASRSEEEWIETENKMKNMEKLLFGH